MNKKMPVTTRKTIPIIIASLSELGFVDQFCRHNCLYHSTSIRYKCVFTYKHILEIGVAARCFVKRAFSSNFLFMFFYASQLKI